MKQHTSTHLPAYVPFVYEMAISFFGAAREALDPVLQSLDGYERIDVDEQGKPMKPDAFTKRFARLSPNNQIQFIGTCLRATTNLGLAYIHVLRLLVLLETKDDMLAENGSVASLNRPLEELYDALPDVVQQELIAIYETVDCHDIEMEIQLSPSSPPHTEENGKGPRNFREQLGEWQNLRVLHESHLLFAQSKQEFIRFLIPLRAMFILDRIISRSIARRLGIKYQEMNDHMSTRSDDPKIGWDGKTIFVALPDKLGRILEAKWDLNETSVVRIREEGSEEWSPGFETPFFTCTFVDLEPTTKYEVQITRKNETGEGLPVIRKIPEPNSSIR